MHALSKKRYVVRLSVEERELLAAVVKSNRRMSRERRTRAQVLLKVDDGKHGPGWTDARAAEAFDIHEVTVRNLRERLVTKGFDQALERKPQENPSVYRKIDGRAEALLIATVQGEAPEGRARWSLRLLSDKIVELGITDEPVSHETIRRTLKKTRSSRT
jgi:hypothetical protein